MDVILGVIIALAIISSVDRHLYPEDYRVTRAPVRRSVGRVAVRRVLAGRVSRARAVAASHRCSITQVSPWLTSEPRERVTVRH
jgi:hypothetical protein